MTKKESKCSIYTYWRLYFVFRVQREADSLVPNATLRTCAFMLHSQGASLQRGAVTRSVAVNNRYGAEYPSCPYLVSSSPWKPQRKTTWLLRVWKIWGLSSSCFIMAFPSVSMHLLVVFIVVFPVSYCSFPCSSLPLAAWFLVFLCALISVLSASDPSWFLYFLIHHSCCFC